jgi:mRNA interferase HigB
MRIIKESRVKQFMLEHPLAIRPLQRWVRLTRAARWTRFADIRATFPDADKVAVNSGNNAVVFDIHGNDFRLITAVHFMRPLPPAQPARKRWADGRVYIFYFLTHAQYQRNAWKETL